VGDLTLVGAGSEWFWTMVSGLLVAVTFIVIYRQLRVQAAANALQRIETINRHWTSTEMVLARLHVLIGMHDGTLDVKDDSRVDTVLSYFELVWDLRQRGYLDDEDIGYGFGAKVIAWWRYLEPVIRIQRSDEGDPDLWIGLERLNEVVSRYDHERNLPRHLVRTASIETLIAGTIKRETHRLQLARDAASGVIPRVASNAPEPLPVAVEASANGN
jgi:hypothetical protein